MKKPVKKTAAPGVLSTCVGLVMTMLLLTDSALAEWPTTAADFKRLPRYCAARLNQGALPGERERWEARIGHDFLHIHHYCAAQHSLHMANSAPSANRQQELLGSVVSEINYVESHAKPTFFLRPEMSVQKGRALARLKKNGEAMQAFGAALKVNPKFPAAYAGLADVYLSLGQADKAKQILDQGISAVPNSKALRQRRARLN